MNRQDKSPFERNAAPTAIGASLAQAIGARNLMIIIVTMPLVFLIVVMATIAVFGRPGAGKDAGADLGMARAGGERETLAQPGPSAQGSTGVTAASPASLTLDPAPLVLPPGAEISSMALDGDRLVLSVDGKDGGEIIVYDLASGAMVQRIKVVREIAADGEL